MMPTRGSSTTAASSWTDSRTPCAAPVSKRRSAASPACSTSCSRDSRSSTTGRGRAGTRPGTLGSTRCCASTECSRALRSFYVSRRPYPGRHRSHRRKRSRRQRRRSPGTEPAPASLGSEPQPRWPTLAERTLRAASGRHFSPIHGCGRGSDQASACCASLVRFRRVERGPRVRDPKIVGLLGPSTPARPDSRSPCENPYKACEASVSSTVSAPLPLPSRGAGRRESMRNGS